MSGKSAPEGAERGKASGLPEEAVEDAKPGRLPEEATEAAKSAILYGTGYGRPPQHTRFRKGQSGNPKGRPRVDKASGFGSAYALTLKEAERRITVREGDKVNQISTIEAVHRAQSAAALKGNAYAQKHVIENYQRAEQARRREVQETCETWEWYVQREREAHAHAVRNGLPAPITLPHPDDVVIDSERGVSFIGPFDEASAERLRATLAVRDVLIVQDALQQREDKAPPGHEDATALVCAMRLDQSVPQRYRLSEQDWVLRLTKLRGVTKRELRRRLTRDWAALGVEWRPESRLPALSDFVSMFEQLIEEVVEASDVSGG